MALLFSAVALAFALVAVLVAVVAVLVAVLFTSDFFCAAAAGFVAARVLLAGDAAMFTAATRRTAGAAAGAGRAASAALTAAALAEAALAAGFFAVPALAAATVRVGVEPFQGLAPTPQPTVNASAAMPARIDSSRDGFFSHCFQRLRV